MTMAGNRGSWWLKLERAESHLAELDREIARYAARDPYVAVREIHCELHPACWRFTLQVRHEPDRGLAMIAGDAVHNMRTALDHIAAALVPSDHRRDAAYPIGLEDNPKTREGFQKRLRGADPEAMTIIRETQPYLLPTETERRRHGLAVISHLDNLDKHRQLMLIASGLANAGSTTSARGMTLNQFHRPDGFAVNGTELFHFADNFTPPLQQSEVRVEIRGRPSIAVDIGIKDGELELTTLWIASKAVREEILPALEALCAAVRAPSPIVAPNLECACHGVCDAANPVPPCWGWWSATIRPCE